MEHISEVMPRAAGMLVQPMKADPTNTKAWAEFDEFEELDKQVQYMKREAASFVDDMLCRREPRWLSLLGTSGAGKTMLAKIAWRVFRAQFHLRLNQQATDTTRGGREIRYRGGFINWGNAINNRMLKGDYEFLEDLRDYDFFVIDDIASEYERHRELSASKLYNVLEARLGKWTVITANLSLDQIGTSLDARIASRMLRGQSVVVDVDVPDFNLRHQSEFKRVKAEMGR